MMFWNAFGDGCLNTGARDNKYARHCDITLADPEGAPERRLPVVTFSHTHTHGHGHGRRKRDSLESVPREQLPD
jgi:hypothetical protein